MNTKPGIFMSTAASDECRQMLNYLMFDWPEEPGDDKSPAFLRHLCHCRDCLRKWIALEAAADLASVSLRDDTSTFRVSDFRDESAAHSESPERSTTRSAAGSRP